jgi:hypothetical protein
MDIALSIVALVISVISGGFSLYTFVWTARRDRKQATLEAYNRLQTEVFDAINAYSVEEIEEICNDKKSVEYKILSGYLARIEHFCIGVNSRVYDDEMFYSLAHGYFDGYLLRKRIEPILESKNSNTGNEIYYINTYSLLQWMDKKAVKE